MSINQVGLECIYCMAEVRSRCTEITTNNALFITPNNYVIGSSTFSNSYIRAITVLRNYVHSNIKMAATHKYQIIYHTQLI